MIETENKLKIPENFLIKAGIDSSTLIRLFNSDWKSAEIAMYQQFFKIKVSPTVYEEFLNYQGGEKPKKLAVKKKFLKKILVAEVQVAEEFVYENNDKSMDEIICEEYSEMEIDFIIADDVHFEELIEQYDDIFLLNAKHLWWKFGEFKK